MVQITKMHIPDLLKVLFRAVVDLEDHPPAGDGTHLRP